MFLEVLAELELAGASDESYDGFQSEPHRTGRFDDEERVQEVGSFVLDAMRIGEHFQRFHAEQDDRD